MKRIAIVTLLFVFCVPVWAQQLPADAPSREEVLKLVEVTRVRSQLDMFMSGMIAQMKASMRQSFTAKVPNATEKQLKVLDTVADEMGQQLSTDELVAELIPIYQRAYSHDDINAIVGFYSSPAGKKLLDKTPQVMQEAIKVGSSYAERKLAPYESTLEARVKKMMAEASQ